VDEVGDHRSAGRPYHANGQDRSWGTHAVERIVRHGADRAIMRKWAERAAGILAWFIVIFVVNGFAVGHEFLRERASGKWDWAELAWAMPDAWLYLVAISSAMLFNSILRISKSPRVLLLVTVVNIVVIGISIDFYVGITSTPHYCKDVSSCQTTGVICWATLIALSLVYLAIVETSWLFDAADSRDDLLA
jgi:hypothetical protein